MTTPIALQLYTIRDLLAQDFESTIRKVSDMGYVGVETANMFGGSPASAAKLFGELGLTVGSAHSALPVGDQKQEVIDTLGALHCKRLIVAWQPPEKYKSLDGIKSICDSLNEGAAVAKANGLQLGYHNHWFEYELLGNRIPIDVMLEDLDPDVFLEVNVYWVQTAGQNPVDVVRRFGGSVRGKSAQDEEWRDVPLTHGHTENNRGLGVSDMVAAIRENRSHRANGEMAFHVLDLMQSFEEASTSGQHIEIHSRCERPAAL